MRSPDEDLIASLKRYLEKVPPGKIHDQETIEEICSSLIEAWRLFDGSRQQKTYAYKLSRMEDLEWNPPTLSFCVERHGSTALGSIYADIHYWAVNIANMTADCDIRGKRQLLAKSKPLNVKPLAGELAGLIVNGKKDERIKWYEEGKAVRINIGMVIPSEGVYKQTLAGRRKRFAKNVESILSQFGWVKAGLNHKYKKSGE